MTDFNEPTALTVAERLTRLGRAGLRLVFREGVLRVAHPENFPADAMDWLHGNEAEVRATVARLDDDFDAGLKILDCLRRRATFVGARVAEVRRAITNVRDCRDRLEGKAAALALATKWHAEWHDARDAERPDADRLNNDNPELVGLVGDLRDNPGDDRPRRVLWDFFQDIPASTVELHKTPKWLRPCWQRLAPRSARGRYSQSNGDARHEIEAFMRPFERERKCVTTFDHWGRTTIAGLDVLVSEPYADDGMIWDLFAPLAAVLGCAHAYASDGYWYSGTARAMLFPPLVLPPPKSKRTRRPAR